MRSRGDWSSGKVDSCLRSLVYLRSGAEEHHLQSVHREFDVLDSLERPCRKFSNVVLPGAQLIISESLLQPLIPALLPGSDGRD